MSFRGRLRLFFTIIVIVPMIAVALVLFVLTAQNETGKADAGIAGGVRVAFRVYEEASARARDDLRRIARDRELGAALAEERPPSARARMRALLRRNPSIVAIVAYGRGDQLLARAGDRDYVAPASAPIVRGGEQIGRLTASVTTASAYSRRVSALTGLEISVARDDRNLAATLPLEQSVAPGSGELEAGGRDYRHRVEAIAGPPGPPVEVGVFDETAQLSDAVTESRVLIGAILLGFLILALVSSVFVVRALQAQIGQFLDAARRIGRGDFSRKVPTPGGDEFAALGAEFNSMSEQLATKIEEVERQRRELEEAIRRVGAAFAAGLDRQGIVELAVATAVEACEAQGGRAMPIDPRALERTSAGSEAPELVAALEAAEREAFRVSEEGAPEVGAELLATPPLDATSHSSSEAHVEGVHAIAAPMRARVGPARAIQYFGVIAIARQGDPFSSPQRELLEYLAAQAVISIENVDLHETIQRQAVTDELTGLANLRMFHVAIDREIERARRFETPLGLVMLDLDDFKPINDEYGHQQGDEVLVAVARALRELSRDIDEPVRYGGEEMAVVLPQTNADGAALAAERMRGAIERLEIPRLSGAGILKVTASFGVAALPDCAADKAALVAAADEALYRAKRGGKNRVERAQPTAAAR